jgi:hypothetical protein
VVFSLFSLNIGKEMPYKAFAASALKQPPKLVFQPQIGGFVQFRFDPHLHALPDKTTCSFTHVMRRQLLSHVCFMHEHATHALHLFHHI